MRPASTDPLRQRHVYGVKALFKQAFSRTTADNRRYGHSDRTVAMTQMR